jgi:hypothetical protein
MFGSSTLGLPVLIKTINNPNQYYKGRSGSALVFHLLDGNNDVIARGQGVSHSQAPQQSPYMEFGKRKTSEIITGAMPVGQISVNTLFTMESNDRMPTVRNLPADKEFTAIIQIGPHEDPEVANAILNVFKGVKFAGEQGNMNANSIYVMNYNFMYIERLSGAEWAKENGSAVYNKIVSIEVGSRDQIQNGAY